MAIALTAWVWIGFTLAQLSDVESHPKAHSSLNDHDEQFDWKKPLFTAAPRDDRAVRSFRVPVWNFLQG